MVVYLSSICEATICINNCGFKGVFSGISSVNFVYKQNVT